MRALAWISALLTCGCAYFPEEGTWGLPNENRAFCYAKTKVSREKREIYVGIKCHGK